MADDNEPTPVPTDGGEPTAAIEAVPDTPTVVLNITQMTADEPSGDGVASGLTEVVPAPEPRRPDRQKQLTIGLAAVAAVVLLVAVVVVSTNGDDGDKSAPATVSTPSASTLASTVPTSSPSATSTPTTSTQPPIPSDPTPFFTAAASTFAFSHDGSRIATAGDGPTTIWDLRSGDALVTLEELVFRGAGPAFTADDRLLVTTEVTGEGGGENFSHSFSVVDGRQVAEFLPNRTLSADGRYMVGSESGVLVFEDVNTGDLAFSVSLPGEPIYWWVTSPDGRHALVAGNPFAVTVADVISGEVLYRLTPADGCGPDGTRFSEDGRFIVCPSGRLLDTATGEEVLRLADAEPVAVSADGSQVLTLGSSSEPRGTLRVWDTATGRPLHTLALPVDINDDAPSGIDTQILESGFTPGGFSSDGRRVVATFYVAEAVSLAVVWDVASEELIFHRWGLQFSELSPDGTMIAGIGFGVEVYRL